MPLMNRLNAKEITTLNSMMMPFCTFISAKMLVQNGFCAILFNERRFEMGVDRLRDVSINATFPAPYLLPEILKGYRI
ncbi:Uncharacterised protein [Candidatus Bartonella washoeensis]|uniref:Uncharacterized protein n=2 Tax=Candidatus Bartonella washoeensis TaxID=186739 RepID=J1JK84_9HYPH|nr:hypothetical protein MCQ_00850 [Bartonella washoeensis Sb944nv]EJF85087.1 hypothetical protein MCW_00973 [Bartonella washoeensis 085-0475]SPU26634.1 Uncharacterised protein [Bartonella washoeensis]